MVFIDMAITAWSNALQPPVVQPAREVRVVYYKRRSKPKTQVRFQRRGYPGGGGVAPYEENVRSADTPVITVLKTVQDGFNVPETTSFCRRWDILLGHVHQWRCRP